MSVRILRVPPARVLEGVDLTPFAFERGRAYDVDPQVARVLILWDYASLEHVHVRIGGQSVPMTCPRCQTTNILRAKADEAGDFFYCPRCDHIWSGMD